MPLTRRGVLRTAGMAAATAGVATVMAACSTEKTSNGSETREPGGPSPSAAPESAAGAADLTQPAPGVGMFPGYAQTIAQFAYVWGWPMINMLNRRAKITQAPHPGLLNGVLPAAPQGRLAMLSNYIDPAETFVTCPNQDVVYGLAYFSLDDQPVIVQVPDFGDRFWVYALYDARTDQFGELGKPYGTKPGFYLLAGPEWKGEKPDGVEAVIRSATSLANAIPRVFMDDTPEDHAAIQPVINQIDIYPLDEFDGKMKTTDWANAPTIPGQPSDGPAGETKWVYNDKHLFHPNDLKRYSLGTKNKTLQPNPDGSLTLYAGVKSPGPDTESNWLPAPAGPFSLYIRAYWGEPGITEGTWKPPAIEVA